MHRVTISLKTHRYDFKSSDHGQAEHGHVPLSYECFLINEDHIQNV